MLKTYAKDVGIVAPYSSQVELYEHAQLWQENSIELDVGTAEWFQGREKILVVPKATKATMVSFRTGTEISKNNESVGSKGAFSEPNT